MEYFSYDACEYDRGRRSDNISLWVNEAVRLSRLSSSSYILDLGCGTGSYALGLVEKTHSTVLGLDPSSEMIKEAQLKDSERDINWLKGVAESVPIRSASLDLVLLSLVWHHLRDRRISAKECHRILRHGSSIVIRTVTPDQWRGKTICGFFPDILRNVKKDFPTVAALRIILTESGFSNMKSYRYRIRREASPEEFIEAAEKGLWSMFKFVNEESLTKGINILKGLDNQPIRNDELITLVVATRE